MDATLFDPNCKNPLLKFGKCEPFCESWDKIANKIPPQPSGNTFPKMIPPFGITPLATPKIPYEPLTTSITRSNWEGWRYGANYMSSDTLDRPYGFPDYTYYRGNYCGPCCPCVAGTNPPLLGDPNGKNPNIRYVQLDYKNLLGSGFATQGTPPVSQTSPLAYQTSCGKDHCMDCSGVYKKNNQPFKFQVCIGDPAQPKTVQPCPAQPMKIYLPLSVLPLCRPEDDENNNGNGENCQNQDGTPKPKQMFEVFVPGQEHAYQGRTPIQMNKGPLDPCGTCNACTRVK